MEHAGVADVIVLGAGWAGMGGADHLLRNKKWSAANKTLLVLEASNITGGRTRPLAFGDSVIGGKKWIVERGSNWVCGWGGGSGGTRGQPDVTENPVHVLARKANFTMTYIPGSSQNMSNYQAVLDENGKRVDLDGKLRRKANKAWDCINATDWNNTITTRDALHVCGWSPSTPVEWAVDWVLTVDDPGEPAATQAATDVLPDESYMWWSVFVPRVCLPFSLSLSLSLPLLLVPPLSSTSFHRDAAGAKTIGS